MRDDDISSSQKQRRVSNRVGCNARIIFKRNLVGGYFVQSFVERYNHGMTSILCRKFLKVNWRLDLGHQRFVLNCDRANIGSMR